MLQNHTTWYGSDLDGGGGLAAGVAGRRRFFFSHNLQNPHNPIGSLAEPSVPDRYVAECRDGLGGMGGDRRLYCSLVRQADDKLGATVQLLGNLGHYNSTLLLLMSDNGGNPSRGGYNNPLRGQKSTNYEVHAKRERERGPVTTV